MFFENEGFRALGDELAEEGDGLWDGGEGGHVWVWVEGCIDGQ